MNVRGLLILGATLLAGMAPAAAQTPAPAPATRPPTDNSATWTLQWENAAVSFSKLKDRFYTNGLRIGWTSSPSQVPETLRTLGTTLWGAGEPRISFDLTHQFYNPADVVSRFPSLRDRPYAGVLMGHFGLVQDAPTTRSTLVLGLGLVGPAAGAKWVQNGFHDLIGQKPVNGWDTQLKNEPLVQLTSERTWRVPIATFAGIETDALPSLTASVGNLRAYIQTGVTVRLGQGVQSDFGPARPRPGITGGDHFRTVRPFAWYVFVGADGRVVGRDLTLDGNSFQNSRSARKVPFVGEVQGGLAVLAYGVRLTYTHRFTSQEFRGQKGGLHQMGSLALSVRF